MNRWTFMVIKAYIPAFFAFSLAFGAKLFANRALESSYLMGFYSPISWASVAIFGIGVMWALYISIQLWRWSEGKGDSCHCGGMLGAVRDGIRGRSDYRKCMACGDNYGV